MNLAEVYLLSSDLSILKGMFLDDFFVKTQYKNNNGFSNSIIFPVSIRAGTSFSPVLHKVGRWGRHILFQFSTCTIVLRMAYRTEIKVASEQAASDIDMSMVVARMTLGKLPKAGLKTYLFFLDPLKCGGTSVYPMGETPREFAYLGMDVLDLSFTTRYLVSEVAKAALTNTEVCVKSFMMDRGIIAWVDNPIATEALFISGINPFCKISHLDDGRLGALTKSLKVVYRRAIEIVRNDFHRTEKTSLDVIYSTYGRDGEVCAVCDCRIVKSIIDGLDTYWCPNCQAEKIKSGGTV